MAARKISGSGLDQSSAEGDGECVGHANMRVMVTAPNFFPDGHPALRLGILYLLQG